MSNWQEFDQWMQDADVIEMNPEEEISKEFDLPDYKMPGRVLFHFDPSLYWTRR